jgi:predicted molibdopterin-dependent oxidoreductase YjgC
LSPPDPTFHIQVDGQPIPARPGQTIAAALIASGQLTLRHTPGNAPRGIFCGMGVCFDCTVNVVTPDGVVEQRACMTLARPGMQIQRQHPEVSHAQDCD